MHLHVQSTVHLPDPVPHVTTKLAAVAPSALSCLPQSCHPFTLLTAMSIHFAHSTIFPPLLIFHVPKQILLSNETFKKENVSCGLFVSPPCWQSLGSHRYVFLPMLGRAASSQSQEQTYPVHTTNPGAHKLVPTRVQAVLEQPAGHLAWPLWEANTQVRSSTCSTCHRAIDLCSFS